MSARTGRRSIWTMALCSRAIRSPPTPASWRVQQSGTGNDTITATLGDPCGICDSALSATEESPGRRVGAIRPRRFPPLYHPDSWPRDVASNGGSGPSGASRSQPGKGEVITGRYLRRRHPYWREKQHSPGYGDPADSSSSGPRPSSTGPTAAQGLSGRAPAHDGHRRLDDGAAATSAP